MSAVCFINNIIIKRLCNANCLSEEKKQYIERSLDDALWKLLCV